jgi:predicted N-acyltransferase
MTDELRIRILKGMADVAASDWDACADPRAGRARLDAEENSIALSIDSNRSAQAVCEPLAETSAKTSSASYNPFISHAFLLALEASGSATAKTGWMPQHLVAERDGRIVGVVPCYLKSHSRGEYVFDRGWADAYERAGGSYYPKLQVSVPFTPATGPRLLVPPGPEQTKLRVALAQGLVEVCHAHRASSVHVTFMPKPEWDLLAARGYLQRTDQQFHWENGGYASFEEFLSALAARKRKAIRRERRDAVANGIEIVWLTGADITEAAWDAFFAFYMETGSRKWGRPYLTRRFYSLIGATMADRVLLVMAKRAGRYIAGAINFIGSDTLFGRHWGAVEHHPFLHFEVCYYQAIEYAITHRLKRVEAGAQGEHKLARGYMPQTTYSAHYIADPALRRAIADYLVRERAYVEAAGEELGEMSPFRKNLAEEEEAETI